MRAADAARPAAAPFAVGRHRRRSTKCAAEPRPSLSLSASETLDAHWRALRDNDFPSVDAGCEVLYAFADVRPLGALWRASLPTLPLSRRLTSFLHAPHTLA